MSIRACLLSACLCLPPGAALAADSGSGQVPTLSGEPSGIEWLWELDGYYSNIALSVPIDDRPVPDGGRMRERDIYRALFRESLRPRVLLLEASVYPLPAAGTWLRKHHPDVYDDFTIGSLDGEDINVIEGLTAGFQEPWAMSAFVGGEMRFTRADDRKRRENRGYMGYLASFGRKHIRENVLIDDTWWELEWKMIGEREFRDERLNWSFRLGVREHGNPDIRDLVVIGAKRSSVDFRLPWFGWTANSSMELKTELAQENGKFLRQEIIFGKKFPVRRWRIAGGLEAGIIVEKDAKYTGQLAQPDPAEVTFVLRPNIDW